MQDEGVGYAVEAVFAEFVFAGDGRVDGVGVDVRGDGAVEGGVEVGDVGGVGERFRGASYDVEGGGVVPVFGVRREDVGYRNGVERWDIRRWDIGRRDSGRWDIERRQLTAALNHSTPRYNDKYHHQ